MPAVLYTVCHNLRSRENVGSIFRTADAFGVDKIFFTGFTPTPLHPATGGTHPKITKTALGAEQWIAWEKVFSPTRLIKKLRADGFEIAALEQSRKSINIARWRPTKKVVLIIGNEVSGIPRACYNNAT